MVLLDNVQDLRTLDQDTVQHLQDSCTISRVRGEVAVALPSPKLLPLPVGSPTR